MASSDGTARKQVDFEENRDGARKYEGLSAPRRVAGEAMDVVREFMSTNLRPIRWGMASVTATGLLLVFMRTRPMVRYKSVSSIPPPVWRRSRRLRVSVEGFSADGTCVYAYHWPFLRRMFFADKSPSSTKDCLLLKPVGVDIAEGGLASVLPKGDFLTCQLLWRDKIASGAEEGALEVGVANLLLRQSFGSFRTPVSEIILRQGKGVAPHALVPGECANTSSRAMGRLRRLDKKLKRAQKQAQMLKVGVWEKQSPPRSPSATTTAAKRAASATVGLATKGITKATKGVLGWVVSKIRGRKNGG